MSDENDATLEEKKMLANERRSREILRRIETHRGWLVASMGEDEVGRIEREAHEMIDLVTKLRAARKEVT